MSLEIEEVLFDERSEFQHVQVFKTKTWGVMLCLDGVIQVTERDECSYQEMITNLPMCAHPAPARVAVIGGGDGGVLREVVKHPSVKVVDHCEIDPVVGEVSKRFLPEIASGYLSPLVNSRNQDGAKWLAARPGHYDVIIVDSSDPVGPAESLFSASFYALCKEALAEGGILCTQGECMWNNLPMITELVTDAQRLFSQVKYAYTTVPTYPSGQIGFLLCTDTPEAAQAVDRPVREHPAEASLRYYSKAMHAASFVLPRFAEQAVLQAARL